MLMFSSWEFRDVFMISGDITPEMRGQLLGTEIRNGCGIEKGWRTVISLPW